MMKLLRNVKKIIELNSIPVSTELSAGVINMSNIRTATITAKCTFNASATQNLRINCYYSADGEEYDTVPFAFYDVNVSAGDTVQETKLLNLPEIGYIAIKVENLDSSYTITNVRLWFAYARYNDEFIEYDKIVVGLDEIKKNMLNIDNRMQGLIIKK